MVETMVLRREELGVELRRYNDYTHPFPEHAHEHYVVGVVRSGSRDLVCNGRTHRLPAGSLLVLNPGDAHACTHASAEPLVYDSVNITAETLRALCAGGAFAREGSCVIAGAANATSSVLAFNNPATPRPNVAQRNAFSRLPGPVVFRADAFDAACAVVDLLAEGAALDAVEEALCVLLVCLTCANASSCADSGTAFANGAASSSDVRADARADATAVAAPSTTEPIQRAAAYLRAHCAERVSLQALASVANLSKYQVVRGFARQFGLTPHKMLASVRIERACELLACGAQPAAVAQQLGFSDQPHFTRVFRQRTGFTPAAYRNALAAKPASLATYRNALASATPSASARKASRP